MMLFSFIVPVYNTSKYLNRCIESILCQKGADYEILLVDDGSTDNSGKLCDHYAKQFPDIVRVIHKENEGLLLTRRRGFKEAKGEWFINVDSDDYIAPDLLESVVNAIERYQPDMVMYNYQYFTDAGEISSSKLNLPNESVFNRDNKELVYTCRLLSNDINSMCMKALRRDIIDIDADYRDCGVRNMCEDAYQVLPLFTNANKIVYLSQPLYSYRKGQASITATRSFDDWMASKICFLQTERYLDIWNIPRNVRQIFYTHYTELLSNFLRWLFSQNESSLPQSFDETIKIIRSNLSFTRCLEHYDKHCSTTRYMKLSVPVIMKYVQKENVKGLKRFFALEKKIRSGR